MVVQQEGFEYRPERPNASEFRSQKWGWTSSKPGGPRWAWRVGMVALLLLVVWVGGWVVCVCVCGCRRGAEKGRRGRAARGECAASGVRMPMCFVDHAASLAPACRLLGRAGGGHPAGQQPRRGRDAAVAQSPQELRRHGRRACGMRQWMYMQPHYPGGHMGAACVALLHDPLPCGWPVTTGC